MLKRAPKRAFEMKLVEAEFPARLPCRIALVGEAPGEEEARLGLPFRGGSGRLLTEMLRLAGIDRADCLVTNVFTKRPPENNVGYFFVKEREAKKLGHTSPWPKYGTIGYLRPEWEKEMARLKAELERAGPTLVVALGATALWALTGLDKITKVRGSLIRSTLVPGLKVLPTYHPAHVLRVYDHKPTVCADLAKAKRESAFPEIRPSNREIWIEPTLGDLKLFEARYLKDATVIAYDIETDYKASETIACISFAADDRHALVIPFIDKRRPDWSYWNERQEQEVWKTVQRWLADPRTKKLAQNGPYDIQWLYRYGCPVRGAVEDTMLLAHALQPELEKSLGYLASIHADEPMAWKQMVSFSGKGVKKDA